MGLPDLEERRETLSRGLGFEDAANVPGVIAEAITTIISSDKAETMTFADFKAVANAAMVKVTKEGGDHNQRLLADAMTTTFKLFRPSLGADDLEHYKSIYHEFERKESKSTASAATSQKLVLK